ncbi:MAG: hypothetical protein GVY02_06060 [Bacteroidetes bacterium]|nr:hypothetical protein [Bacteroidota bacterium]
MENSFTQAVLMTALFITLVTGCEQIPTTSDNPPETTAGDRLLSLPQNGSTPVPELAKSAQTNSQKVSATMMMLKQLRQQSPDAPFAGVLSLLQNPGEEEKDYTYHQINLPFSKGITQRSEGVDLMYRYVVRTERDEILLQFEAVIPKDDKAAELVKRWIEKKIVSKAGREGKSSDSKQLVAEPVANSVGDCNAILDPGDCEATLWVEGFGWILDCGLTVCAAGPGDWPPPPPDDPDWTDPNDCDDPTGFDCGGTGGGDDDGGGGSGDDCDPTAIDQPAGYEEPEPEPCQTGDPNLDNTSFQQQMAAAWVSSFGDESNPLPHDQRNEAMILVTAISSGLEFEEIVPDTVSSCRFSAAPGTTIPTNTVALIHTHPYSDGDVINDPRCSAGSYNGTTVSPGDEALMQAISDATSLPPIPMYVIDKDKIRVIQPSNPSQYAQTDNRCGY